MFKFGDKVKINKDFKHGFFGDLVGTIVFLDDYNDDKYCVDIQGQKFYVAPKFLEEIK